MAEFEPARFAREFRSFLEAYNRLIPPVRPGSTCSPWSTAPPA